MQKLVVLVTGSSSGLGKTIAEKLSGEGFVVYGGARRILPDRPPFHQLKLDVTSEQNCLDAVKLIIKKEGRLDILVNNAGISLSGPSVDFKVNDLLHLINTNALGPFRLIKAAVPYMRKQKFGKIINITSLNGLVSLPNFGLYSASKFAMEGLGRALRYELLQYGIWVTNVAPGAIAGGATNSPLPHKPAREKFKILYFLMPMITREKIAQKIIEIIEKPRPPASMVLGNDAKITAFLQKILPSALWDKLLLFVWNKK